MTGTEFRIPRIPRIPAKVVTGTEFRHRIPALNSGTEFLQQLAYLRKVNWNADFGEGAQDASRSYTHSMCMTGDSAGACSFKISNFINVRLDQANQLSSGGQEITNEVLDLFGQALHAMEDMGSPAHVRDDGNPIPWGNGLKEGAAHVWAERDAHVNWLRLGQSIRLAVAAFSQAFPSLAKQQGNPDVWAQRAIASYVSSYFAGTPGNTGYAAEDAARQCALGNPAACVR